MFSYMKSMMFSYMFLHIVYSKVQHEESLEMQSWDDVGRLLRLEGTKPGAMVSIMPIGIDPHMGYPSSQA